MAAEEGALRLKLFTLLARAASKKIKDMSTVPKATIRQTTQPLQQRRLVRSNSRARVSKLPGPPGSGRGQQAGGGGGGPGAEPGD